MKLDDKQTMFVETINNILDYSKLESKNIILESVGFNFSELAVNVYQAYSNKITTY